MMIKYFFIWLGYLTAFCFASASIRAQTVNLRFVHKVGTYPLELDKPFTNDFSEPFTISKFRYYISGLLFQDTITGKKHAVKEQYFLIKEGDEPTKTITVTLPAGTYNKLSFLIGVDSAKNKSGAQSGTLDPLNGMFWTWKSGYIMMKLEGKSTASPLQRHMFEYHIGGYEGDDSVLKITSLGLPDMMVLLDKETDIWITVDINKWFNGVHRLPIAEHPACTTTGLLAKDFADNYRSMFFLKDISVK